MLALFPFFSKKYSQEELVIIRFVLKRFGHKPKNVQLFKKALTHKSISNNLEGVQSNERLEFLGDSVLDAIVAEFLFDKFPDENEGYLTKIKSKIVNRKTLSTIGHEMEIESILNYNRTRTIKIETIEGNAFEALIGAIYLDAGYEQTQKCVKHHVFRKYMDLNQILEEEIDFKSKLFIWSQKNRLPISFEVLEEVNEGSSWRYLVKVMINDQEYGRGSGSSKKKAEQAAAMETLELMGEL